MNGDIGVFDSVVFFIVPATARRLEDNNEKMVSMLRSGAAVQKPLIDDDVTHIICNRTDFLIAQKSVSDSVFCSFLTPKWVFISQSLQYRLPVRSYSADPFHFFSGLVFYFHNCSIPLTQVYLPLCIHRGAQVLTSVMSQCTHVIAFNSSHASSLPQEAFTFPQIRVVSEEWLEVCINTQSQVDETPYLVQPINEVDNMISFAVPNSNFIYEWENDIRLSVDRLFSGCNDEYAVIFANVSILFLPTLDRQEQFFLTCSVEKMGGKVLRFVNTLENSIDLYTSPHSVRGSVTHIICPFLKPGQKRRLMSSLGTYPVQILSSNWLYSCIDQYSCISTTHLNPWDTLLFTPTIDSCIASMRGCVISITGFSQDTSPTREQVKSAVDSVGACYMGPLCKDYTTHLICWSCESDKCLAAWEWKEKIKVVKVEWLMECMKRWERVDEESYLLQKEKKTIEFSNVDISRVECISGCDEKEEEVLGSLFRHDENMVTHQEEKDDVRQSENEVNEDEISTGDEADENAVLEDEVSTADEEDDKTGCVANTSVENILKEDDGIDIRVQDDNICSVDKPSVTPMVYKEIKKCGETKEMDVARCCISDNVIDSVVAERWTGDDQMKRDDNPLDISIEPKRLRLEPDRVFLFSSEGCSADTTALVMRLGGRCIQTFDKFDASATHFIIPKPKRTEKYLGAVACGLWVLRPEYLEECARQGRWVDETAFEWREAEKKSHIDGESIRQWRERGGNAFKMHRVVLVGDLQPAADKWERIITAGGGDVVVTKSTVSSTVKRLVEAPGGELYEKLAVLPDRLRETKLVIYLKQRDYKCISSSYLLDFLSKYPLPEIDFYILH